MRKINNKTLEEWQELAWKNVSPELETRIVQHLQSIDAVTLRSLYEGKEQMFFQHSSGMELRNYLRKEIPDVDLPPFDEYYGEGTNVRNWDDYYMKALELAVNS